LDDSDQVVAIRHPRKSKSGKWSYETSLFIAFGDYEEHAFKGLFRREVVVEKGVWLFDTQHIISPERCWEFGMSLLGPFHCFNDFIYLKRYHPGSTHQAWQEAWRPVDILYNWYYKFRYQWMLDRKPLRITALLLLMAPLTIRKILLKKLQQPWKGRVRMIPGRLLKKWIRLLLSRI
jgi:hypothetical protein